MHYNILPSELLPSPTFIEDTRVFLYFFIYLFFFWGCNNHRPCIELSLGACFRCLNILRSHWPGTAWNTVTGTDFHTLFCVLCCIIPQKHRPLDVKIYHLHSLNGAWILWYTQVELNKRCYITILWNLISFTCVALNDAHEMACYFTIKHLVKINRHCVNF